MVLQPGVAATSSASSIQCPAEFEACSLDEECLECNSSYGDVYDECKDSTPPTNLACQAYAYTPCCLDIASDHDCLGNSAFEDLWSCLKDDKAADYYASIGYDDVSCPIICTAVENAYPGDEDTVDDDFGIRE